MSPTLSPTLPPTLTLLQNNASQVAAAFAGSGTGSRQTALGIQSHLRKQKGYSDDYAVAIGVPLSRHIGRSGLTLLSDLTFVPYRNRIKESLHTLAQLQLMDLGFPEGDAVDIVNAPGTYPGSLNALWSRGDLIPVFSVNRGPITVLIDNVQKIIGTSRSSGKAYRVDVLTNRLAFEAGIEGGGLDAAVRQNGGVKVENLDATNLESGFWPKEGECFPKEDRVPLFVGTLLHYIVANPKPPNHGPIRRVLEELY